MLRLPADAEGLNRPRLSGERVELDLPEKWSRPSRPSRKRDSDDCRCKLRALAKATIPFGVSVEGSDFGEGERPTVTLRGRVVGLDSSFGDG